jgi:mRNA interferase MazF
LDGGEIVWIDFDPVRGTEQAGARPALVLSETSFNAVNRRAIVCPISSRRRDWPFEEPLPDGLPVRGVVLLDQERTVDRLARGFRPICTVPAPFLARVRILVGRLIGLQDQTF